MRQLLAKALPGGSIPAVRTVIVIAIGFALLAALIVLTPRRQRSIMALCFIFFWMIVRGLDLWHTVKHGGYAFGVEVALHAGMFAILTSAAWAVMRKFSSKPPQ